MTRFASTGLAALACLCITGCSMMAPTYSASIPNVQKLKDAGDIKAKVGAFDSAKDPANANPISIRGSSLNSPYNSSYSDYLAAAIRQELEMAGKLSATSDIEISGTLLKNDLDASGFSTGYGTIEARFIVKKGPQVRYDKVKAAKTQWDSSFVGAVAIPKAQQEYSNLVQQLLIVLYGDQEFTQALK
jgi:hypothetical protein